MDNDASVLRQMHVQLRAVRTERNGIREGAERVLRSKGRAAAMGKDQGSHGNRTPTERHGPSWNSAAAIVTSAPQLAERPARMAGSYPGHGGFMKRVVSAAFTAFFVTAAAHAASEPDMRQAEQFFEEGQFDQARAIYETVAKGDKLYQSALRQLGAIALYKNHLAEAELMLINARARNPADDRCATLLAETYAREGKFSDMADLLRQL